MTQQTGKPKPGRSARPCPICSKMSIEKYHPFCSVHCANIDLHHWLNGSYAIPAEEGTIVPGRSPEPGEGDS